MAFNSIRSTLSMRSFARTTLQSTPSPALLLHRRLLSDQARATLDTAVKAHPLVLFMKGTPDAPQCGFSRAVIQMLDLHGVPPTKMQTYNVLADPELRTSIKEYSEWPTIPQLYVDGEFVGGCDIVMSMHQNGELEKLFTEKKIVETQPPEPSSPTSSSTS